MIHLGVFLHALFLEALAKPLVSKMLGFGGISWTFRELAGIFVRVAGIVTWRTSGLRNRFMFTFYLRFCKKGMSIAHFLVPFLHTFIFSPSWTMIRVEHFHRENVRMTSLYFFFQNLFSKPLVSKIVTTHESFLSKNA